MIALAIVAAYLLGRARPVHRLSEHAWSQGISAWGPQNNQWAVIWAVLHPVLVFRALRRRRA